MSWEDYNIPYSIPVISPGCQRGYGIIIVNHFGEFEDYRRQGSDNELRNLRKLFEYFGLETKIYEELKNTEISKIVSHISHCPELKDHSLFMLAISSHGTDEGILGVNIHDRVNPKFHNETYNDTISHQSIIRHFNGKNCENLRGKPKVFIFNGCRGDEKESLFSADAVPYPSGSCSTISSDYLILYSCVNGFRSLRKGNIGSNFIDILTNVWMSLPNIPLESSLAYVNRQLVSKTHHFDEELCQEVSSCCNSYSTLQYTLKVPTSDYSIGYSNEDIQDKPLSESSVVENAGQYCLAWKFIDKGSELTNLNEPRALTIGNEGLIYIADFLNNRIQIFDIVTRKHIKSFDKISQPLYLDIFDDFLFVTSLGKIMKICLKDGIIASEYIKDFNIRGIAIDNISGSIFVSEKNGLQIHILNKDLMLMKRMRLEYKYIQHSPDPPTQISDIRYYNAEIFILFQNSQHNVQSFTLTGKLSRAIITKADCPFSKHFYVGNCLIIISDLKTKAIKIFSAANGHILAIIRNLGESSEIIQPVGITYDMKTQTIIVVDHAKTINALMGFKLLK